MVLTRKSLDIGHEESEILLFHGSTRTLIDLYWLRVLHSNASLQKSTECHQLSSASVKGRWNTNVYKLSSKDFSFVSLFQYFTHLIYLRLFLLALDKRHAYHSLVKCNRDKRPPSFTLRPGRNATTPSLECDIHTKLADHRSRVIYHRCHS